METVTKQMAVAVTRCSRDLRYLWANQAYANWIQRPLNDIVERPILEVLGKDAFEALLPHFNRVLKGETVRYEQETNFRGLGPRWVSAVYTPTLDADGAANGWVAVVVDITERRRAEQALRESDERFRLAAQAGKMFAYSWDATTDVIERSGESASILGIDETAPLTGHQAISRVHPDDREGVLTTMAGLTPEKPFLRVTYRIVRPDDSVIWVERHSRAYFDEHGKVERIVGMIVDITESKRAEVALLRHAAIVESSDNAIVGTDLRGTVTDWNKGAERLFGYLASEAIGKSISFLAPTGQLDQAQHILKKVISGDVVKHQETVRQRKDGTHIEISLTASPIVDAEGRVVGASGIARDITEWKQSEKALRESEERFRSLYENSTLGLYRTTSDGKILLANPSLVKMLGFSSFLELAERNLEEEGFEPGYERAEFKHRLATEGEVKGLEASWTRRDGTAIFVRESARAIRDAEGKIAYYEGTVEDITERKRAEEALRQSEEKFLKAFRGSPVAITLSRVKDRRFIEVNDTFERLFGYRREEVIGRTASDLGLWVDPSQRDELRKRLLSGQSHRDLELRFRMKNGSVLTCLVAAELIEVANEPCILSVASDITERKLAEEVLSGMTRKLVEAQEQERARIARELHDDINQRIALLAIELDQLREKHKNLPSEVQGHVQELQQMTSDISSRVYALSHKLYSSIPDSLGLAKGMRSWCREFGKQQKMEIDFKSHDLPRLPQEISLCLFRVLQEALHNAAKHSGVKRIEVQIAENSGEIHLIVSDSGRGFDIDAARRRGGLGLMSMQERVRLVGGTIVIDSKPLAGTTVHVHVPFKAERDYQYQVSPD